MKILNPRLVATALRLEPIWKLLSRLRPSRPKAPEVRTVLVIDLHLIGDVVMLIPLLWSLRERHPSAHITLLAGPWAEPVLRGSCSIDEIIPYEAPWVKRQSRFDSIIGYFRVLARLRRNSWDLGIDVRGDIRQILLLFLAGCRERVGFDFTGGGSLLTSVVPDDGTVRHVLDHHQRIAIQIGAWDGRPFVSKIRLTSDEELAAAQLTPYVGFHLGASLPLRRLPSSEAAKLVSFNARGSSKLVLFATPDMESYISEVLEHLPRSLVDRIEVWRGNLREFIVKASRAICMFTMDSGPAHIAAALGRETIVFFGPNLSQNTAPRGPKVLSVEDERVPCRPCDQRHCINATYQACMRGVVDTWHRSSMAWRLPPD